MTDANKKPTAWVIEDDPKQSDIFAHALQQVGFNTETIYDGIRAIERLSLETPSLVLLDLHLPGINGDRVLDFIRNNRRTMSIPVIIATSDPHMSAELHGESDLILIKPISFIQLRELATRLLPKV